MLLLIMINGLNRRAPFILRTNSHAVALNLTARWSGPVRVRDVAAMIGSASTAANRSLTVASAVAVVTSLILCAGSTASDLSKPARHWQGRHRMAKIAPP